MATKAERAADLRRLARFALGGHLPLATQGPARKDVAAILGKLTERKLKAKGSARFRLDCRLFAKLATAAAEKLEVGRKPKKGGE